YAWTGVVENWHDRAFASFGDGHGVWETGGGALPFHARNFTEVRQWTQALAPDQLMPTIRQLTDLRFRASPPGAGTRRPLIVTAAKDGDLAYVGSDWNEGIEPFAFGARFDLNESRPLLRGTVFSDRGVYKLGEEVHFKAILRRDLPAGIQLIASGSPLYIV